MTTASSEPDDRIVVERARAGDREAIGALFTRYWRAARGAAFGATGDWTVAEDAAAEAFRHALEHLDALVEPASFGPWLRTIARRAARREQRRRRLAPAAVESGQQQQEPGGRPSPELAALATAMRALPDAQREALTLVYFEGFATDEAARLLAVPAGTLRRRLHDGRRRLRAQLEEGGADWAALFGAGRWYEAFRRMAALRPPPPEAVRLAHAGTRSRRAWMLAQAARWTRPSARAVDPQHPVGAAAAAAIDALRGWPAWPRDGIFRHSRALVHTGDDGGGGGRMRSIAELVAACPDEASFAAQGSGLVFSDVLDLTFSAGNPQAVTALLESLAVALLPATSAAARRVSPYAAEARYGAAGGVQLLVGDVRLACGGALQADPERHHARIFLEGWAALRSGTAIRLEAAAPATSPSSGRR